ncbi:putative 2OG-Fe(II) oxygenase [bacterium]|nr:putative 2OG-Fe(II) oxygenase [bacterium]
MKIQNIALFPTNVTHAQHEVSKEEQDLWFDLYLKHSNEDGRTHDLLGYEQIQLEPSLEGFFKHKVMPSVREYFKTLSVDSNKFNVHITKTFFNVVDDNGINKHNHEENHISFTYYPYIKPGKERCIILYDTKSRHSNEINTSWFFHYVDEWTEMNCTNFSIPVGQGSMLIFPSNMNHDITKEKHESTVINSFKTKEDLLESRFCVAGDMIITKKPEAKVYMRTLSSPENWKTFG